MKNHLSLTTLTLVGLLLGACATDPPTRFYTLVASPELAGTKDSGENQTDRPSFGVGPVHLSGALENIGVVTSNGQHQLVVSAFNVWAEGLEKMISNVIADNLSTLSGNHRVWAHPWDSRTRPEHQLRLIVEEFGGALGGTVTLRVKWTLLSDYGKTERQTFRVKYRQQTKSEGYPGYVAAMNGLLTKFSEQLYVDVRKSLKKN